MELGEVKRVRLLQDDSGVGQLFYALWATSMIERSEGLKLEKANQVFAF
jgi:hypothetical protein